MFIRRKRKYFKLYDIGNQEMKIQYCLGKKFKGNIEAVLDDIIFKPNKFIKNYQILIIKKF